MLKKVKLKDAVGTKLAHDITEIRPGEFKGPAFHKGHTVCNEDLCHLQKLGKNHLYLIDLLFGVLVIMWVAMVLKEGKFTFTYPFGKGHCEFSRHHKRFLY